jgi:hypothetical protein
VAKLFPDQLSKEKITYTHGEFKERTDLPPSVSRIKGSLVIDMPLTDIKEYLTERLELTMLMPDDMMV